MPEPAVADDQPRTAARPWRGGVSPCRRWPSQRPSSSLPHGLELAADDTIEELCRRLENLPLAVELAAARARVLSPAQILERLSGRLDLLKGGRDADPRQQTLRATIEWSHDLLSDDEKDLFARMAVFAGGGALEAAEKVADADIDTLQALVDKSLLRQSGGRFWMLETIREFAVERLNRLGLTNEVRSAHAQFFLDLAEEAEPHLIPPTERDAWHDRLESEHDNLRAAIEYFQSRGETEQALRLAGAIGEFWEQRSHHQEALRRYLSMLQVDDVPTPARAKALSAAAMVAPVCGEMAQAQHWAEEALALYRHFRRRVRRSQFPLAVGLHPRGGGRPLRGGGNAPTIHRSDASCR